jgi:hypothetical protein
MISVKSFLLRTAYTLVSDLFVTLRVIPKVKPKDHTLTLSNKFLSLALIFKEFVEFWTILMRKGP